MSFEAIVVDGQLTINDGHPTITLANGSGELKILSNEICHKPFHTCSILSFSELGEEPIRGQHRNKLNIMFVVKRRPS